MAVEIATITARSRDKSIPRSPGSMLRYQSSSNSWNPFDKGTTCDVAEPPQLMSQTSFSVSAHAATNTHPSTDDINGPTRSAIFSASGASRHVAPISLVIVTHGNITHPSDVRT